MSHGGQTDKEAERMALVAHDHDADDAHGADAPGEHGHEAHEHIHMPPPSFWPFLLALFITILFAGFLSNLIISAVGAALILFAMIQWGREGSESKPRALTYVPVIGEGDAEEKLAAGARVISLDGKFVGRITAATEDSPTVRQGWVPTRYGFMPRAAIDHIEEGTVVLNLTEAQVRARGNVDVNPAAPGSGQIGSGSARALPSGTTQR